MNDDHTPDLSPVREQAVCWQNLTKGFVVVFESTVYPELQRILYSDSGKGIRLTCGRDFKIGYSPERINPGTRYIVLETITKIVSGMDEETLDVVARPMNGVRGRSISCRIH